MTLPRDPFNFVIVKQFITIVYRSQKGEELVKLKNRFLYQLHLFISDMQQNENMFVGLPWFLCGYLVQNI